MLIINNIANVDNCINNPDYHLNKSFKSLALFYSYHPKQVMRRVLVIDDDTDLLIAVKAILKLKGYDAFTTNNPHTVEATVKNIQPDLVLMDVNLAQEDGRNICRLLKANEDYKNLPVILFSADHSIKNTINMYGADAFIEKPFEARNLFTTIDRLFKMNENKIARSA